MKIDCSGIFSQGPKSGIVSYLGYSDNFLNKNQGLDIQTAEGGRFAEKNIYMEGPFFRRDCKVCSYGDVILLHHLPSPTSAP